MDLTVGYCIVVFIVRINGTYIIFNPLNTQVCLLEKKKIPEGSDELIFEK